MTWRPRRSPLSYGASRRPTSSKVPHHGSARQDPAFLAAARSRLALISVGAGNDYGHPATSTVTTLTMLGNRIHRTDVQGDIAVVTREGALAVVARGP